MIKLIQGDWVEVLRTLAEESVHCVVNQSAVLGVEGLRDGGVGRWVASRLMRNYIGIDLSLAYNQMAEERITDDAPLFNCVIRE